MASSLETNKLLAAVLTAGIIASGAGVISRILYSPVVPLEPAYQVAVAEGEGEGAAQQEQPLPLLLANASAEEGEGGSRACAACHSFEEGGAAKVGPPLWGVVGRDIGSVEGFSYSDALAGHEGQWTFENLSEFLADPRGWAPGTKMAYAGIGDADDRAAVLVYLRSLSDEPEPLPEVDESMRAQAEGAAGGEEATAEGGAGFAGLVAEADPAAGESAARPCVACHSFEAGGPTKIGPPLHDVVGRDIGSVEGFSYSDALTGHEGQWTYDNLDQFLNNPREWAPGTKMAFAGVKDEEDRAAVVAYLRSITENPPPLPEAGGSAEETEAGDAAGAGEPAEGEGGGSEQAAAQGDEGAGAAGGGGSGDAFAALVAAGDPGAGERAARACVACHSFEAGGPTKIGPPLHDVVGRPIASVEGFSYSSGLAEKEGDWTYDNLDHFLANPREWAPGTKMAFAGVRKDEDRANIVAYLRSITENPPPLPGGG